VDRWGAAHWWHVNGRGARLWIVVRRIRRWWRVGRCGHGIHRRGGRRVDLSTAGTDWRD
jgi:hypothetical protein